MVIIRPIILNINKPLNWTSRDVLNKLQLIYNYNKFGHAGTLDPLATGVLVVLVANENKKQRYYMNLEKEYQTRIFIGVESKTQDLEGPFTVKDNKLPITNTKLKTKIKDFLDDQKGVSEQIVPFYSAVKVNGKELYKHARSGKKIQNLPVKEVELNDYDLIDVYTSSESNRLMPLSREDLEYLNKLDEYEEKLQFLEENLPYIDLKIKVGKGYYVRSLARDLGKYLKSGAVMGSLIRTSVGEFKVEDSFNMDYFNKKPDLI